VGHSRANIKGWTKISPNTHPFSSSRYSDEKLLAHRLQLAKCLQDLARYETLEGTLLVSYYLGMIMLEQVRGYADRHIDICYLAPPKWGFVLTLVYYESRMYYFKTLCEVLSCANITTERI